MPTKKAEVLADIAHYYSAKLEQFGQTPQGVDWNGEESQRIRFEQLIKVIPSDAHFSINDLGCGYGALLDFLNQKFSTFEYTGIDISESMVQTAMKRYKGTHNVKETLNKSSPFDKIQF